MTRINNKILQNTSSLCALIAVLSLLFVYCAAAVQPATEPVNALQAQLEQLGWQVEHTAAGDLLLWPPGQQQASAPTALLMTSVETGQELTAVMNLDALRDKLIDQGWDVRTNSDGSLLLYFNKAPTKPDKPESPPLQIPNRFEQLKALLLTRGWLVKQDQTGNLEVYPRASITAQSNDYTVLHVENTELDRLSDTLNMAGWRLQEQADGSLRLYADSKTAKRDTSITTGNASAEHAGIAASIKLKLPVDSLAKAHRIAKAWARQQSRTDLVIGRISRVHWIYLVEVFQNTPPYYLHNQLAIRHKDGRIFPLL